MGRVLIAGAVALVFAAAAFAQHATQSIMDSIFADMGEILPASFNREKFSDPKARPGMEERLTRLAANAERLQQHGASQDRAFEFVAMSLARDARTALRRYKAGHFDDARFTLHNMTDNCIACHSSLPEGRKFPDADRFFAKLNANELPPLERAHFMIVSRQFDKALESMEQQFMAKDIDPALVPILGSFTDYLKVSISVKSDFQRPQKVLRHLIERPSTPLHVKQQLQRWLAALNEMPKLKPFDKPSLATAKQLIDEGRKLMEFARDRDGLVHYMTAEAVLQRFIRGQPDGGPAVAEAYYLLGATAGMTEHSFWITRSDFYYETAIRLAPEAAFAPKALAQLEESLILGYTGSSGTNVPDDVELLLAELRTLIEKAHAKKS
jgi:hypothetical protein